MRKLIKSKERVRDYGEVYTPQHIINEMLDMLEKEDSAIFAPSKTFLEPACGDGNFLVAILERKLKHCTSNAEIKIAVESLYGIDILADNVQETRKRMQELLPFDCMDILSKNIVCGDSLKPETIWFLSKENEDGCCKADGFYMGWSVGCTRYRKNDGVHAKVMTQFNLNSKEECIEWWKGMVANG